MRPISRSLRTLAFALLCLPGASVAQSPAGLVTYVRASTEQEIRMVDARGTNDRRVWAFEKPDPHKTIKIYDLAWRPDGKELAFSSTHENHCSMNLSDVFVIRADGSGHRRVTQAPACADLARYPKATVRVPVKNVGFESFTGFLYFQGAPSAQAVSLPAGGSTTVTVPNVAALTKGKDSGQVATLIAGLNRAYFIGTAVQPQGGKQLTTNTLFISSLQPGLEPRSASWHPSGTYIAYAYGLASLRRVPANPAPLDFGEFVVNAEDGPDIVLHAAYGPTPALAGELLVQGWDFTGDGIYRVKAGAKRMGAPLVKITDGRSRIRGLAWLPDGSGFVYSAEEVVEYEVGRSNIFRYDFASRKSSRVTNLPNEYAGQLSVSPDGRMIAFDRSRGREIDGTTSVWRVTMDGSGLTLLANDAFAPAWKPGK
ncbi:PD40 domain-containing protein [Deinococcus peraridilitoris]|uniref:Periplasmic component of the Tol biopolymer transport system n=1 Tax=Deinococcus peraridilitoris (strain DSM 19664 / LMG 22246 / CIP 109416 / KR-200) TaxID=937777 RepID=L0A9C4_DEIPD|nr:PD40 domain-containing protein [Deinococcus peraridilitoris]AFZ69732.1 periplasmic component of the Tol biopolymer transport system [Deinococcus peraridilitoris DSM 19664]